MPKVPNPHTIMWSKIMELTIDERKEWLRKIAIPSDEVIDFDGLRIMDSSLAEALANSIQQ